MSAAVRYALIYVQRTFGLTDYVVVSDHDTREAAEARGHVMTAQLDRSNVASNAMYRVVAMPPEQIEALRFERSPVHRSDEEKLETLAGALA